MPQAPSVCLIQCKICNLLRKKGVGDSLLLRGNMSQEPFPCSSCKTLFHVFFLLFFRLFSHTHFFHFLVPKQSPKTKKCQKSEKSVKNHPPDLALNSYLQKGTPKCENRIPFDVLSLFPRVPGTPKSITNWNPNGRQQNITNIKLQ